MMKCLGVGGVVGSGEGVFHAPNSDFLSSSCRNMRIYAPAGHFDPPSHGRVKEIWAIIPLKCLLHLVTLMISSVGF